MAALDGHERFAEIAPRLGLRPGFVLDLQVGWDLEDADHTEEIERMIEEQDPYIVVGSPPCHVFQPLLPVQKHVSHFGSTADAQRRRFQSVLERSCRLYSKQIGRGRYFLHEHPEGASSWNEKDMKSIVELDGV
jgi:hypothetical protein